MIPVVLVLFALIISAGKVMAGMGAASSKNLCYEYEAKGYLPANSCYCSTQLFDTWDKSYNWIDACEILEARKK